MILALQDLVDLEGQLPPSLPVMAAEQRHAIHLGDHWRLVVRLAGASDGDATWFAKLPPGALPGHLAPGQPLPMAFDPQQAWLFAS